MGEIAGEPVHMVDAHSNFCKANVDRMINSSAELSAGRAPYAVVSIIGAQSSGKSYLMNQLFGTKFPVMDDTCGWGQTSRGIMMSRCIRPSLLLLDVEGFDGQEKGEDTLFENRSALFALAVSDLMMVNMKVDAIGRQQGSGTNLFRIIFQERTKLQGAGFTKILVVLRDNIGTPLEILKGKILERMQEIWNNGNNKSVKFSDYIEVNVVALPPHISIPEFQTEVTKLRKLLSNNISAKVPASGFSLSSSMFWDTIMKNKALDIPSHQVAVASWYCGQLVKDIIKSLDSQKEYKLLKAEESPTRFTEISHELLENNKAAYNQKAEMYDPAVMAKERQYMVERLHEIITVESRELIQKVKISTLQQFKCDNDGKKIQSMNGNDACLYFEPIVDACISKFMSSFKDEKVFDSEILRRVSGEVKKKLQSYTAKLVKEREREIKAAKDAKNIALIATHACLAAGNIGVAITAACLGQLNAIPAAVAGVSASASQITASAAELNEKSDSPSTSQDKDCDKSD